MTTRSDPPALPAQDRIHSIDQFRGYAVLGMFVVNYLGHYPCHFNYHHNDYFLSYADTIMPMFMFVVGISFRFTLVKRLATSGYLRTYAGYFRRSLALVLISVVLSGIGQNFETYQEFFTDPQTNQSAEAEWAEFQEGNAETDVPPNFADQWLLLGKLFVKSYVWETLAVIGLTQLFVLPFVHLRFWSRVAILVVLGAAHVWLSQWFAWQFFYGYMIDGNYVDLDNGLNNWMGQLWGTGNNRGWDGGLFGILTWGFTMLAGTLCYDLMDRSAPWTTIKTFLRWGAAFLILGYAMSCLSRLYDLPADEGQVEQYRPAAADERIKRAHGKDKGGREFSIARSPVLPDWEVTRNRPIASFFAEPPFVARPDNRLVNYWMMQKRYASLPYVTFVCGLSFVGLALFVLTADIGNFQIPIFRTFGMNPLAAYVLHKMVLLNLMFHVIPSDSAAWLYWSGLALYLVIVYVLVRGLEKQGVYIRM